MSVTVWPLPLGARLMTRYLLTLRITCRILIRTFPSWLTLVRVAQPVTLSLPPLWLVSWSMYLTAKSSCQLNRATRRVSTRLNPLLLLVVHAKARCLLPCVPLTLVIWPVVSSMYHRMSLLLKLKLKTQDSASIRKNRNTLASTSRPGLPVVTLRKP